MREFELIQKFFHKATTSTVLGVGDDAALIQVRAGHQLAISADMSVVGTHFYADAAPYDIGWKSMAVNVSDMAAMGALPKWATLSISLPNIDEAWLTAFSAGFFACAEAFQVDLIGGDTTRGPLNIAVQIMGEVPVEKALKRAAAQAGDDVWVSGQLGSAALGLAHLQGKSSLSGEVLDACMQALHQPQPRVALGLALRGIAHSCIDVSDGLIADLGHILKASNVGARLDLQAIPCLPAFHLRKQESQIQKAILAGGDDYELCFTAPAGVRREIKALAGSLKLHLSRIGTITTETGLQVTDGDKLIQIDQQGYNHFESAIASS